MAKVKSFVLLVPGGGGEYGFMGFCCRGVSGFHLAWRRVGRPWVARGEASVYTIQTLKLKENWLNSSLESVA